MGERHDAELTPPEGWWEASDGDFYPPSAEPDWSSVPDDGSPLLSPGMAKLAKILTVSAVGLLLLAVAALLLLRGRDPGPIAEGEVARGDDFALNIMVCPNQPGERANGSIRNDTEQVISFRIELPYVDADGNDVIVESVVVEELRPLEAAQWEMPEAPEGTIDCAGNRNQVFYEAIQP